MKEYLRAAAKKIFLASLVPDAFSSLPKLLTDIFGLSLKKPQVFGTEELAFTKANFSPKSSSIPLSTMKRENGACRHPSLNIQS